jgi:hypothetical protein
MFCSGRKKFKFEVTRNAVVAESTRMVRMFCTFPEAKWGRSGSKCKRDNERRHVTRRKREYVNEPVETEANLKLENVGSGKRQDSSGYTNFKRRGEDKVLVSNECVGSYLKNPSSLCGHLK